MDTYTFNEGKQNYFAIFQIVFVHLLLLPLSSQLSLIPSRCAEVGLTTCRFQIRVVPFSSSGLNSLSLCKISVFGHGKDNVQDERNSCLQSDPW